MARFRLPLFFCLLLVPALLPAQRQRLKADPQTVNQKDERADRVLKSAKIKMNGVSDFTATFKYVLDNKAAKTKAIAKSGLVKFKRNKYRIDLQDQLLISDGNTVWNYLKSEKEVNVMKSEPGQGFSFDRIFKIYDDDMKAAYDRADNLRGIKTDKVSLYPANSKTDYFRVEMWIGQVTNVPVRMKVYARNGSIVTYDLSDVRTNSNLADSEFAFNPANYPGVEVVDLR